MNKRLHAIAIANGNIFSGCWDVVAWSRDASGNDRLVFAESTKHKHDRIRGTQLRWVEAALANGFTPEDLLLVEWTAG